MAYFHGDDSECDSCECDGFINCVVVFFCSRAFVNVITCCEILALTQHFIAVSNGYSLKKCLLSVLQTRVLQIFGFAPSMSRSKPILLE